MSGDINVQTFSGKVNITSNLLVGSSHLFVDTTNNRVGITTASPGASLEVNGNVHVVTDLTFGGTLTGNGSGLTNVNSDSGSWVNGSSSNIHLAVSTDNVGIGVLNPSHKLDVDGDINIASGSTLRVGGTPAVFSNWSVDGSDIYRSSGNVGIGGAASGTNRLKVHGTVEASSFSGILATDVPTLDTSKISGLANSATITASASAGQNTIVQRNSVGYVFANFFNTTPDDVSSGVTKVCVEQNNDGYIRHGTAAAISTFLGLGSFATLSSYPTVTQTDYRWTMGGTGITSHANYGGHGDWYIRSNHTSGQVVLQDTGGNVGIGTSAPYAKLHVNGGSGVIAVGWRKYFRWNDPNYGNGDLAGQSGYGWGTHSIYASEAIITNNYFVSAQGAISSSDERIKKDIVDVEDGKALDIIRELKPKKYRYKDEINRGVEPVWGFIAQEVNDILPEAVKIDEECLPNIYEMANVSSNVITFTNFDTSTLESNASVLKVFDEDDNEHLLTIDKVIDEHSILVKEDRTESQLFIYGQRVNDFHRIRKETVWTVATAALQEVDRQLQTTRAELTEERTLHETTRTQLRNTQTELDVAKIKLLNIEARMQIIESNISKVVV